MSYARWSNSNWYAFDNVSGKFSLWHVSTPYLDIHYCDLQALRDAGKLPGWLSGKYPSASPAEVDEAVGIVDEALKDQLPVAPTMVVGFDIATDRFEIEVKDWSKR